MYRILFLILMFSFILIKPTNADFVSTKSIENNKFSATTLDFAQIKTANETNIQTLFNIGSIIPGGYQVDTIRIKNQGEANLAYNIYFQKKTSDDNLCRNLKITFSKENEIFYQGDLVNLNLNSSFLSDDKYHDWLITLKLNENFISSQTLNCNFNLIILGYNQNTNQKSGFEYTSVINNSVTFN